jgi:putative PIN family toxin of toxin-antitoxin system
VIKAVYDTNVVVSGLLNPEGIPSLILDLATQGYIRLFLSEEIVKEYEEVLIRPKFGFSRKLVKRLLQKLRTKGKVVKPKTSVKVLKDPADNKFLSEFPEERSSA